MKEALFSIFPAGEKFQLPLNPDYVGGCLG